MFILYTLYFHMVTPVFETKATYSAETASQYNEAADKEYTDAIMKESKMDQFTLLADIYYKKLYEDKEVTQSTYSFLTNEIYTWTDFNDKTDTYINMNISYRYIKYNVQGAGEKYNQLAEWCDFKKDSPKAVFANIITKLKELWYDKIYKDGKWESNTFQTDLDFMYAIWLFQANVEKSAAEGADLSKKDFRVWPKTLDSLLTATPLTLPDVVPEEEKSIAGGIPLKIEDKRTTYTEQVTSKIQLDDAIKKAQIELSKIDPKKNKDAYINKMEEISGLVKQKNVQMTPEEIRQEIQRMTQAINDPKNEANINYLQYNIRQLHDLLAAKTKSENIPVVVETQQPIKKEKQKSAQEIRQEKFTALLNDPTLRLNKNQFAVWNDIVIAAINEKYPEMENAESEDSRKKFINTFHNERIPANDKFNNLYNSFSITEKDNRLVMPKRTSDNEKAQIAEALTKYFNEHKNKPEYKTHINYILSRLALIWNDRTWYDLPYQKDLTWWLLGQEYPEIINYFAQQSAKDLWLTDEQKKLFITSNDVIAFYNNQVEKYRWQPTTEPTLDNTDLAANALLEDIETTRNVRK